MRQKISVVVAAFAVSLFLFQMGNAALARISGFDTEFHGHLQSSFTLRDTTGMQYGFLDQTEGVQALQELLLDLAVSPNYVGLKPDYRIEKIFFRYRGAYDAIFDLRQEEYKGVRDSGYSRFDLDKDDLKFENDMREIFIDMVAEPSGSQFRSNLRLGRQIVQWGESDGFNLINVVNPNDYRRQLFFANPEDLLAPLWMGRLDMKTGGGGTFKEFNLQLLAIPDIRPNIWAPMVPTDAAPYGIWFEEIGIEVRQDQVRSSGVENMEGGVRLGTVIADTNIYLYYFDGWQHEGIWGRLLLDPTSIATDGYMTLAHPRAQTYGYSFATFIDHGGFVFRGEGSLTKGAATFDLSSPNLRSEHDHYQALLGFDKDFSQVVPGTDSALVTNLQIYYSHISGIEDDLSIYPVAVPDNWRATLVLQTNFWNGRITPSLFLLYDFEGVALCNLSLNYTIDDHWYMGVTSMSIWGDTNNASPWMPYIETASELNFKVGWRW
ncbi:MAG: hypothetical protein RBT11_05695 [Desulfobacterales bacterium]|jgi:hypothetical protein|nr:hypothetical protein [Desulfobacterales bacterium]